MRGGDGAYGHQAPHQLTAAGILLQKQMQASILAPRPQSSGPALVRTLIGGRGAGRPELLEKIGASRAQTAQ